MALVVAGYDAQVLAGLKTKLVAFRDAQAALNAGAWFGVEVDNSRPWEYSPGSKRPLPLVNLTCSGDTYEPHGSTLHRVRAGRLTIKLECWAPINAARLSLLKEQVLAGVWGLDGDESDYPAGLAQTLGWPSWSPIDLSELVPLEYDIFAGEWTVEVPYSWTPTDISGTELDEVHVTLGDFAAIYNLGG